ncbi:hypothetical protein TNCV_4624951 [Trichonephila clavipes]|nr:hypothetical protein TNCV_4624951 [Trichonephila clavipes]
MNFNIYREAVRMTTYGKRILDSEFRSAKELYTEQLTSTGRVSKDSWRLWSHLFSKLETTFELLLDMKARSVFICYRNKKKESR